LIQDKEGLNKKLKDQNNELVESQNQYRVILEKSSDGVFTLDAEVKVLRCNARFCSFLEFEINELVGRPIMDILNMDILNSEDHKDINPKIVTYRFADRATVDLKVQFCLNETLPTWQKRKHYSLMLDSYGIWNLPNNKIHDKGTEKTFMGAICIVKNPS
jgi:PAS domain-containing protein